MIPASRSEAPPSDARRLTLARARRASTPEYARTNDPDTGVRLLRAWRRPLAALLTLVTCSCTVGGLQSRYRVGEPPPGKLVSAIADSGSTRDLPANAAARAESSHLPADALERAERYSLYSTTVTVGSGYTRRKRFYCDTVLLGADGRVLGSYRVRERCAVREPPGPTREGDSDRR